MYESVAHSTQHSRVEVSEMKEKRLRRNYIGILTAYNTYDLFEQIIVEINTRSLTEICTLTKFETASYSDNFIRK